VGHVELQRRTGLLGDQGQVDLAVAGQGEGEHVGVARQPSRQRPRRIAVDQADPLL
jgi:hypothetical protein